MNSEGSDKNHGFESIEPEEIQIPVPWGHISGKWWGSKEEPPVIALHGWQDNAGTFDRLAPLIANSVPLLCIDLPGHGYSSRLHDGVFYYLFWDGVILLRKIVKHYKWDKIKILGHSLGGAIGFLYAATYPEEVEALISLDIASTTVRNISKCVDGTGESIDKYLKYEQLSPESVPSYEYNEMLDIIMDAYKGSITKEGAEVLMKRGTQPAAMPGKHYFSRDPRLKVSMLGAFSMDLTNAYAEKITCSYLNIRAKSGLKWDYPNHYQEILNIIKKSASKFEYHEVEGSHHVHLNNPELVAPIIQNFLESLPKSIN
ncbi:probable serine hydrolase isoform X1 [Diachasma alloeum]|uniref:probable serine hydrolase isoform X1 n=1 Tax=Diachasma alloeum TaxID=454923 RepID=UPI0007382EC6|nr:probable serine hydrolase isoform X1 [Diachasma alloeum]